MCKEAPVVLQSVRELAVIYGEPNGGHAELSGVELGLSHYQSVSIWKTVCWSRGGKELYVEHEDRSTGAIAHYLYTSSFAIERVVAEKVDVASGREVFYLLGTEDSGSQVVERWIHKAAKLQMQNAPVLMTMKREPVNVGQTLGLLEAIQVDPAGSFLVVVHRNTGRHISQVDLSGTGMVATLLDSSLEPFLASKVNAVNRARHESEGVLWLVTLAPGQVIDSIVLRDFDSDGVLDDWIGLDAAQMQSSYPARLTFDPWIEDFQDYRP